MSYWILTNTGRIVSRTTVQRVTNLEQGTDEVRQRMKEFDANIRELLKDQNHVLQGDGERQLQDWEEYTDDVDQAFLDDFDSAVSDETITEADQDFTPDIFDDMYLNKEIATARSWRW
ncbi:hypothetical protein MHU86_7488 [Fragilaria crotonensis]|nr:hypothetical protein MHU86_7488 [Fragilaria crotonensis]